jgi:hypothetical protein
MLPRWNLGVAGTSFDDILYLTKELEASFSHCMVAVDVEFGDDSCDE